MSRPILLGPFRGEVGFEVLYWLPWVNWLLATQRVPTERVYAVTRGGAGCWYGLPADHVLDLFTMRPIAEVRAQAHKAIVRQGALKQYTVTDWDRGVLAQACEHWHLRQPVIIHPSQMYTLFTAYWENRAGLGDVWKRTDWRRLPVPDVSLQGVPPEFVVARFYLRSTLQADPELFKLVCRTLETVAKDRAVVLLDSQHHLDDHVTFPLPDLPNVFKPPAVVPEQTLAQQSAILAKAKGFLGTYGGIAQLALRLGVPSVSWYQGLEGTFLSHLLLSHAVAAQTNTPFYVMRTQDVGMWRRLFVSGS